MTPSSKIPGLFLEVTCWGKAKTPSIRQPTSLGFAEPGKPFLCLLVLHLGCWQKGLCSEENASQAGGAQGWA